MASQVISDIQLTELIEAVRSSERADVEKLNEYKALKDAEVVKERSESERIERIEELMKSVEELVQIVKDLMVFLKEVIDPSVQMHSDQLFLILEVLRLMVQPFIRGLMREIDNEEEKQRLMRLAIELNRQQINVGGLHLNSEEDVNVRADGDIVGGDQVTKRRRSQIGFESIGK
jgi:hypothetical protein